MLSILLFNTLLSSCDSNISPLASSKLLDRGDIVLNPNLITTEINSVISEYNRLTTVEKVDIEELESLKYRAEELKEKVYFLDDKNITKANSNLIRIVDSLQDEIEKEKKKKKKKKN